MDNHFDPALYRSAKPGDIITFGAYPQTADGTDRTPIKWRVLQNAGRELLILSEYILDCKRYHSEYTEITWRDCDLRQWLNDVFYHSAFTDAEKEVIKTIHNTDNGEGSPDTDDQVFLLSTADVNRLTEPLGRGFRRARGTEFAKIKKGDGCHLYVMDKNVETDYITEGSKTYGCSWWWLRNQGSLKDKGSDPTRAVFIGTRASIRHYARVDLAGYGVRPAVILQLPTYKRSLLFTCRVDTWQETIVKKFLFPARSGSILTGLFPVDRRPSQSPHPAEPIELLPSPRRDSVRCQQRTPSGSNARI